MAVLTIMDEKHNLYDTNLETLQNDNDTPIILFNQPKQIIKIMIKDKQNFNDIKYNFTLYTMTFQISTANISSI